MAKKSSKRQTGEGSYQISGTISREGQDGRTYHDTVFYVEDAKDDQDAVSQWKKSLSPAMTIVKYTVIFLGALLGLLILGGAI